MQRFGLESGGPSEGGHLYRSRHVTRIWEIDGPFEVETPEGLLTCEEGYLARDIRGEYFPISREVFALTYERVGNEWLPGARRVTVR